MKYRVLDLIVGSEHHYACENSAESRLPYDLQEAKDLLVRRATEAIETGRHINLVIIDEDNRAVESVAINVFP